jgi:hypothetical protein
VSRNSIVSGHEFEKKVLSVGPGSAGLRHETVEQSLDVLLSILDSQAL